MLKLSDKRANLFHILIIRWATLANAIFLFGAGIYREQAFTFAIVVLYCLLLTVFWQKVTDVIKRYSALILIDLTISAALIALTRGSWASPYFLYGLTSIIIASFFLGLRAAFGATAYFSILYLFGIFFNKETISGLIQDKDVDLIFTSTLALFLLTGFFGYPAHVIRTIDKTKEQTALAEEDLNKTMDLIAEIVNPSLLSCRELEILTSLSEGKSNKQIAEKLCITERTVKTHLYRIYKKLGVTSREEAITYFHSGTLPVNRQND